MDLREPIAKYRHPWELSRTDCALSLLRGMKINAFADIGAGDRYFTKRIAPQVTGEIMELEMSVATRLSRNMQG